MANHISKEGKRFCARCYKTVPLEHFVIKIENGLSVYHCSVKLEELSKIKPKKYCSSCKKSFELDHFIDFTYKNGKTVKCCKITFEKNGNKINKGAPKGQGNKPSKYDRNTTDFSKNNYLIKNYGITLDDYNQLRVEQNYCCKICEKHESLFKKSLFVDHCHITQVVRGLLCYNCNSGLGFLDDDIDLISSAIQYLKSYE